jgi:septal ring factor EnvC (AmiA/AmiB activator)
MPVVGSYRIVHRFGTNTVTDVKGHVTLDKKGIDIKGQPGAAVRCIFDGEVSAVFSYSGTTVVIVRHGSHLSVYCDLASVNVSRGQRVSTNQTLGRLGSDGMMQFQLRKGNNKLNPESWLSR